MATAFKRNTNLFKKPTFHFHRFLFIFSLVFCFVSMILIFANVQLQDILVSLLENSNLPDLARQELQNTFIKLSLFSFFAYIGTGLFIFFYSLFLSHKFAGPVYVIINLLRQLQSGNYKISRQLREGDELKEIMEEIHALAKILEEKGETTTTFTKAKKEVV